MQGFLQRGSNIFVQYYSDRFIQLYCIRDDTVHLTLRSFLLRQKSASRFHNFPVQFFFAFQLKVRFLPAASFHLDLDSTICQHFTTPVDSSSYYRKGLRSYTNSLFSTCPENGNETTVGVMRTVMTVAETGNGSAIAILAGLKARDQEALAVKDLLVGTIRFRNMGLILSVTNANQMSKIQVQTCSSAELHQE
jgi:hypothetical protein